MKKIYLLFIFTALLFSYSNVKAQSDVFISSTGNDICPGASVTLTANTSNNALTTLYSSGEGAYPGNMFDITATNEITITRFDGNVNQSTQMEIYYKVGTYVGSETVASDWILVGTAYVNANGAGVATSIPIPVNVTIPAGQTYGFYITTTNVTDRLSYSVGNSVGTLLASDANLQIFEGCGLLYPFGNSSSLMIPRKWHGSIYYYKNTSAMITTTLAGGNNHRGNMFDIVAVNAVKIKKFDAHPMGDTEIAVYYKTGSFVGFESNAAAWTLIGTATVVAQPMGTATPVPVDIDIIIPAGETYAFYVTSTNTAVSLNYSNGTTPNAIYTSDANIQFLEGVGLEYPFTAGSGSFNSPRIWNGNIYYELPESILWSTGETTSSIVVSPQVPTTYSVDYTANGSEVSDNFDLNVYTSTLDLGADFTACFGDVETLDAGAGYTSYDWNDGYNNAQTLDVEAASYSAG
ncbi:MAG: hypothetical protein CVU05_14945, partial [Bacteroidetes bacterium HGW-Bacteroidetes-21]